MSPRRMAMSLMDLDVIEPKCKVSFTNRRDSLPSHPGLVRHVGLQLRWAWVTLEV